MKKFGKVAAVVLALSLVCGCLVGCAELLFGVDVTFINDTNDKCEIRYSDYIEGSTNKEADDDEFMTKITLGVDSEVEIHIEYGTRIKLVHDNYGVQTLPRLYASTEYRISDIYNRY